MSSLKGKEKWVLTFSFIMVTMLKLYLMVLKARMSGRDLKQALFSARTLVLHWEQVYMLSPSSMSFTQTSSRLW